MLVRLLRGSALGVAVAVLTLVLTRPLMRLVAVVDGGTTSFSWLGTLGILMVYLLCLVPGSVLRSASDRWWSRLAVVAGTGLLAYAGTTIAADEVGYAAGMTFWRWLGLAGVVAVMVLIYAAAVVACWRAADAVRRSGSARALRPGGASPGDVKGVREPDAARRPGVPARQRPADVRRAAEQR